MKIKSLEEKVKRTYYLQVYQVEALKALSIKTRVKQVDFVREAVDDLIFKYREIYRIRWRFLLWARHLYRILLLSLLQKEVVVILIRKR